MKTRFILFLFVLAITFASCKTSKDGCAGASYQGEKFKAKKFKWY